MTKTVIKFIKFLFALGKIFPPFLKGIQLKFLFMFLSNIFPFICSNSFTVEIYLSSAIRCKCVINIFDNGFFLKILLNIFTITNTNRFILENDVSSDCKPIIKFIFDYTLAYNEIYIMCFNLTAYLNTVICQKY